MFGETSRDPHIISKSPQHLLVSSADVDMVQGPTTRIDGVESILQWMIANYTASHPEQFRSMVGEDVENSNGPWIHIEVTLSHALSPSDYTTVNDTTPEAIDNATMLPATNPPISIRNGNLLPHPNFPLDNSSIIGDNVLEEMDSDEEKQFLMFAIMQNEPTILQCIQGMHTKCKSGKKGPVQQCPLTATQASKI